MRRKITLFFLLLGVVGAGMAQSGNYVFSGGEAVNFGTLDLATPGGQTWATDRLAQPGYFSAVNGAVYTGATDVANVNGYVKKYGNAAFTFPVGTGSDLRTLGISAPALATDAYATAWIVGDPGGNLDPTAPNAGAHARTSVTAPIVSVSPAGQWDWLVGANMPGGETGTGAGLTITVSIPDMSTFAITSNLRLVGWNGTSWVDLSGSATASGNIENSTLSGTMQAGITAIAIGSTSIVLPVKLSTFTAAANECTAILNWATATEEGKTVFEVQYSKDGNNFTTVHSLPAVGNAGGAGYNWSYAQPDATAYYRLRMVDADGKTAYSSIQAVRLHCLDGNRFSVSPNPVYGGSVTFSLYTPGYKGKAVIYLFNAAGQRLSGWQLGIAGATTVIKPDVSRLPSGVYMVRVTDENGKALAPVQKLVKVNNQ